CLGDREPSFDRWPDMRFRRVLGPSQLEVGTVRVDAVHGYVGLSRGYTAHGVGAVTVDVALLDQAVTALELDRPKYQGLALVGDLPGHVPPSSTASDGQRQHDRH